MDVIDVGNLRSIADVTQQIGQEMDFHPVGSQSRIDTRFKGLTTIKQKKQLTFPVDVRILIFRIFFSYSAKRMKSKIGDFQHKTAVHHAVTRFEVAMRPDFRRVDVGHPLCKKKTTGIISTRSTRKSSPRSRPT